MNDIQFEILSEIADLLAGLLANEQFNRIIKTYEIICDKENSTFDEWMNQFDEIAEKMGCVEDFADEKLCKEAYEEGENTAEFLESYLFDY